MGVVLLATACGVPADKTAESKLWTSREYLAKHDAGPEVDFGGWHPGALLALRGEPMRFPPSTQTDDAGVRLFSDTQDTDAGLVLFPGVADGVSAPFVITDLWSNHPEPWVQPVWAPRDELGRPVMDVVNVFPVGLESTFYSPYWRAELLPTQGLTVDTYKRATDVLNRPVRPQEGPMVLCPFVEDGVGFANDGSGLTDPATLRPVQPKADWDGKWSKAWVEGETVRYFDFGADRAPFDGQHVIEANAYFFVTARGQKPLPITAVLPSQPLRHALVRRVDVVLPPGSAPYVPDDRPGLRTLLEGRGVRLASNSEDGGVAISAPTSPCAWR